MSNNISKASVIKAATSQVSCRVGNETVVLQVESGQYLGLNAVATVIWDFVQQPRTFAEVCDLVLGEFEVGQQECETDLITLLEQLSQSGLIEVTS